MNGILDNGPIPPEAMMEETPAAFLTFTRDDGSTLLKIERDGTVSVDETRPASEIAAEVWAGFLGWFTTFLRNMSAIEKASLDALEAKAAAFREDMIERVTRKTEADE